MRSFFSFRNLFFYSCLLCFFLTGFASNAQTTPVYGNEWINYNQPFYKIKVASNGMHRLTYTDLVAAGISNVNPQKFQLFRRGRELAIYVNGQADGVLNAGDYIDFYGKRNDGETDVDFYSNPANQVHKYYSLFTDTAAYFLTWGNANGKRMVEKTSQTAGLTPEPRHYGERLKLFTSGYFAGYQVGATRGALGDMSEGYLTNFFRTSRRDTIYNVNNVDPAGPNPVLEAGMVSAYYYPVKALLYIKPPTGPERLLTNATTGSSGQFNMAGFDHRNPKFNILPTDIHPNGTVHLRATVKDSTAANFLRLAYYKLTYPKVNNLSSTDQEIFTDSLKTTPSYFLFSNAPVNAVGYDITDPFNVTRTEGVTVGNQKGFVFDPSTQRRNILIAKAETTTKPTQI